VCNACPLRFSREKCKGYNEEYENLYPTREEVLGIANDDSEEDSDD
jgi:hypothetical protein